MLFVIISSILLNITPAQASIDPSIGTKKSFEVPFFKSKLSLFPSGFTTIDNLKKQMVGSQAANDKYYKWRKIYFSQDEIKPLFATHLSQYVIENSSNKRYKVTDTNVLTLQVFDETEKMFKKIATTDVHADAYDMGFVMTLKDVYLRTKPSERSEIQTTIPQGTRLSVNKYDKNFALINYQNYEGYVDLSEIITKFDFATFVFANNEWQQVKKRDFDHIITTKNKKISINSIKGLITPESRGIIASSSQKIPMWSQVEISQLNIAKWNQSQLKEHGLVWWQPVKKLEQELFTIDELIKKDVSSVSFHPQDPLKGILSANGVYITQDGYHWRKLPQFDNFNGPVYYFNDSLLFVGNFKSTDGGATFDNYIQIDKLAAAIEYQFGFTPKKLQVKRIETRAPYRLKLEIETGSRRIKMESPLFAQDWTAAKI
jgi:hypothetical protein